MTKAAAVWVPQKYQDKTCPETMTQLKITGSGGKLVSNEVLMTDQDVLLMEENYEKGPLVAQKNHYFRYNVSGFDTTKENHPHLRQETHSQRWT